MKAAPPLEMLDRVIVADSARELPLHAQVRRALKHAIDDHFDDGQQFWTETALIERLGLSQITVRRALQDLSREGVIERKRALGSFVRKQRAGQMASVGIFVPAYDSSFIARSLEIFAQLLRPTQRRLHVYHTHQGESVAEAYNHLQGTPATEGVILYGIGPDSTRQLHSAFMDRGFRVVTVDSWVSHLPGAHLSVDNRMGIELGLRHLAELGHKRIAFVVSEPEDVESVMERTETFQHRTAQMGIESRIVSCNFKFWDSPKVPIEVKLEEMWESGWHPTAIMAVSDSGAWATLRWAAKKGICVPDQLSVMGFDDDKPSRYMNPALTTTAQPLETMARRALEILDHGGEGSYEYLSPTLVIRESTTQAPTR
jgi:LacI family transcriptional regulator